MVNQWAARAPFELRDADPHLAARLGGRPDVQRVHIGATDCGAGMIAGSKPGITYGHV
jgi:hypothetical protein